MRIQDITEATQDVAQQPQQQNLLKRLGGGITKKIGQATSAIGKAVSTGAGAVGQAYARRISVQRHIAQS